MSCGDERHCRSDAPATVRLHLPVLLAAAKSLASDCMASTGLSSLFASGVCALLCAGGVEIRRVALVGQVGDAARTEHE